MDESDIGRVTLSIQSEQAMVSLGGDIAALVGKRCVVFLEGDLGTGKTTLCRGIVRALGHRGAVKSPTYTLVETYPLERLQVCHFDLYRLADPEELELIGGRDYFSEDGLFLVEWPSKGYGYLPRADIFLRLEHRPGGRKVFIESNTTSGYEMLCQLAGRQGEKCRQG